MNDQFEAPAGNEIWDEYCGRLHESDVHAFGITDYFSADCYFTAVDEYRERYPNCPKQFFPNIELRTNYVVNKAEEEVHVHLIFNPSQSDYAKRIQRFLQALKITRTDGSDRDFKAAELEPSTIESATTTREYIREALIETFGRDADLINHVLIVTAANNDGIRPKPGAKRKAEISDELDKFSDAFFGSANNVAYFLKTKRAEDKQQYTAPKPVLSGCDAHSLSDLDTRLGQDIPGPDEGIVLAPTWIKADLTYEGLKQIVFEPDNRVFIGAEPEALRRVRQNGTRYLDSLHIDRTEGFQEQLYGSWFCDEKIVLGKELVAIIGNKGSGKSAIVDVIGLLGNSHNQKSEGLTGRRREELFSFLNKEKFLKPGYAEHFEATLYWCEGKPDKKALNGETATHLPEKVRYLPQKYLERICANIADGEFRATLDKVIFGYVKPKDRHEQDNLDDLIEYLTKQAKEDIAEKKRELQQANIAVIAIEKKLTDKYREELEEKIRRKKEEIAAHKENCPEEKPKPEAGRSASSTEAKQLKNLEQEITKLTAKIVKLETEQADTSTAVEQLRQLRQAIERKAASLAGLKDEHATTLEAAELNFGQMVKLTLDYDPLDTVIAQKKQRLEEIGALLRSADDIAAMDGDDSKVPEATTKSLVCQKEASERKKAELVEHLSKPAREYQHYVRDLNRWTERMEDLRGDDQNPGAETLNGLRRELKKVKNEYPNALSEVRVERARIAKEILGKKRELIQPYNRVKHAIDIEISKHRENLGEYNISIEAGLRFNPSFTGDFLRFINQGAVGSFRGREEGRIMLRTFTDQVTNWEDETQVFAALDRIIEALHTDQRDEVAPPQAPRDVDNQIVSQKSVQELYNYLFGFDYLDTKYDLKVDGKDLSELSPGERGGLLLIFYLMLDRQEIPLVIDQPEDNLDNKSVYEMLVTFIKQAKQRRQIILVTHNPNLAVVADAEQIIHVSIDKQDGRHDFDFFSGAIENPRINAAVVDILEGTLPAFDNRRLKYRRSEGGGKRGSSASALRP